jgi:hypothetical protein
VARSGVVVVVEVVVPDQFLTGGNVTDGEEPDAALDLVDFAVGIAGMVQIGAQTVAVDYGLAVIESIEIGAGDAVVTAVGLVDGDAFPGVLDNPSPFADGLRSVDPNGMDWRRADD